MSSKYQLERLKLNGERIPKMLFDVPDFHNPTGITMSYDRRKKLVQLAEKWNFIILDEIFSFNSSYFTFI